METKTNPLGLLALAGLIFAVAFAYQALSTNLDTPPTRTFSVDGQGELFVAPDIAEFTFSVLTEGGTTLRALQTENTDRMNKAISFLKQQGIEAQDIKTQQYQIEPRYQYYNCPISEFSTRCAPPEIVGYTVRQVAQVKVRELSRAGELISGVVDNGANSVSQLFFTVEDQDAVKAEVLGIAIQKAKTQAVAIATAGGFRLGKLVAVNQGYVPGPYYPVYAEAALGKGGADGGLSSPAIEPGSEKITASVTLIYEIL